jgi:hypothetical protein
MATARDRFIRQLEDAADHISDMPRHELAILLRRAALRLRNTDPQPGEEGWIPVDDPEVMHDPGAAQRIPVYYPLVTRHTGSSLGLRRFADSGLARRLG